MPVRIASLHIHPIKSCRTIDVSSARLDRHGLQHDRAWMVVDAQGSFLSQRSHPALARVRVALTDSGLLIDDHLHVERPPFTAPLRQVRIWNDHVDARCAGDEAAEFFSTQLGASARLVFADAATLRIQSNAFTQHTPIPVHFPDGYPILVCTIASLEAINARLPEALPMSRFRPNVVLEGLEAFEEDGIEELCVDAMRLRLVKPCTRCGVTALDQMSGEKGLDPLAVLRELRYDPALKGVTFGWNAVIASGAGETLRVGDTVKARRRAPLEK